MANKNADFLVDNGVDYDKINFSTVANQVDYKGVSVEATLGILSSQLEEHNHNDSYYTKEEMDNELANKANKGSYLSTSGGLVTGNIIMNQEKMLCWIKDKTIQGRIYNNILKEVPEGVDERDKQHLYILASNEADYALHLGVHEGMWTLDPDCKDKNHQLALGTPVHKWGQIYSYVGSIDSSDRNEKMDIEAIGEKFQNLFRKLKPVSYKFIHGTSGRTHTGFISQDVEEAMTEVGLSDMDFAGFCRDPKTEPMRRTVFTDVFNTETGKMEQVENCYTEDVIVEGEYIYGLRYEEFIALNTAMIQQLMKESEEQKSVIAELKDRIAALEQKA